MKDKERAIDAALAEAEAAQLELLPKMNYLGDRPPITWTPDGDVWKGDVSDWTITEGDGDKVTLAHQGESVVFESLDWAMAYAEIYRLWEGPPGTA